MNDMMPVDVFVMQGRKFLGKPIGHMTKLCFESKEDLHEFVDGMRKALDPFEKNMENMGLTEDRWSEEWMETFLDWFEISQGK